ncbi:hypothetical protein BU23DRAFT_561301 [Bimuria novae-zelandiae CBS 107.79]|uniref:Uncharacterized protein n=1 Tax=Bimuria novae-zelandiae CBS 107.79 TaxID=1447943 RepID=A0A6A5UMU3_9PLEO|nr:hypothetical protein BU23DRAFT_561301 [Bimuria novae-zelandiae CBS 107.79]
MRDSTPRRELPPETKAYAVGAMQARESQYIFAKRLPVTQGVLNILLARTKERSEASKLPLWDPHLYELEPGRGPDNTPLTVQQKNAVIALAAQNKDTREKQSWQAISDGDFDHLQLPKPLTVTSFENLMYEACYARRAPGFKPMLSEAQIRRHFEWAQQRAEGAPRPSGPRGPQRARRCRCEQPSLGVGKTP